MKTPEEWVKESYGPGGKHASEEDLIRAVQADAYHEGQLAGLQLGKETALKTIDEVFSNPTV